jgi:hypothetical protein
MSDWNYSGVSSSVDPTSSKFHGSNTQSESYNLSPILESSAIMPHTTYSVDLNVIPLGARPSIGNGAFSPAIQSPLPVSTGASQSPMHQASYGGLPSGDLTSQRHSNGYDAIIANDSQVVQLDHSGQSLQMNAESVQRIMPHIPDILEADGDDPPEIYGTANYTVSMFYDFDAATSDH